MRVLIAEDDANARGLLESLLSNWDFRPVCVTDGDEAWEILSRPDAPRLALLDRIMPGIEGAELCRRVRRKEESEEGYTYLILVTAKGTADQVVEGLDAGADDYIAKPFHEHELKARVNAGARIVRLHRELLEAKKELSVQARTDPLTGVANRRAILTQLDYELNRARRSEKSLCLALLDIDQFKNVNDTHGHLAGDVVLKEVVRRIGKVTRSYDSVGRFGGEEFVVLLPETSRSAALGVCRRIQGAVADEPVSYEDASISITLSQGVTAVEPGSTLDEAIERADQALYQAKGMGRNQVVWMAPPTNGAGEA